MGRLSIYYNIFQIIGLIVALTSIADGRRLVIYQKNDITKYCNNNYIGGNVNLTYGAKSTIKLTAENIPWYISNICEFRIGVPDGFGVTVHVESPLFKSWYEGSQCINFLEIQDYRKQWNIPRYENLCDKFYRIRNDKVYNTYSPNGIVIKFHTEALKKGLGSSSLDIYVTTYSEYCGKYWNPYYCSNGRCISDILTCDGIDNCGDNSDEIDSSCLIDDITIPISSISRTYIAAYTLFPVIFIFLIIIVLRVCCINTTKQVRNGIIVVRQSSPPYTVHADETRNDSKNKTATPTSKISRQQPSINVQNTAKESSATSNKY